MLVLLLCTTYVKPDSSEANIEPYTSCVQHTCVVSLRSLLDYFSPAGKLVHDLHL